MSYMQNAAGCAGGVLVLRDSVPRRLSPLEDIERELRRVRAEYLSRLPHTDLPDLVAQTRVRLAPRVIELANPLLHSGAGFGAECCEVRLVPGSGLLHTL